MTEMINRTNKVTTVPELIQHLEKYNDSKYKIFTNEYYFYVREGKNIILEIPTVCYKLGQSLEE